jgi:hypothetical protein
MLGDFSISQLLFSIVPAHGFASQKPSRLPAAFPPATYG